MRGAALIVAAVGLLGCRQILGIDGASGGSHADAAPNDSQATSDAIDGPPGQLCYGTLLTVCLASAPTAPLTFPSQSIDTSNDPHCQTPMNGLDACVIAGTALTIPAGITISAHGPRPLVLVATGDIAVEGRIDVAGHGTSPGAAADNPACTPGNAPSGGSGGAGGSFGSSGGNGGNAAGNAGTHGATQAATGLRGGCRGQAGSGTGSGAAGASGGAVALIAVAKISVSASGSIDASGAGGAGGTQQTGGAGGGGSGGMIILDSASLDTTFGAKAIANGGGGGEGAGAGGDGHAGEDPLTLGPASGGTGGSNAGGDGGNGFGSTQGAANGNPGLNNAGGGGGGGGAGAIRSTQVITSLFSPQPM